VPTARTNLDREDKVQEIVEAARRRLLAGGYEAMSVAAIARELKIAQNSIYWYFTSKDDLFAAAFRAIFRDLSARKTPCPALDRVLWATDQLARLAQLRAALRARAAHSATVAGLRSELDQWTRVMLLGRRAPDRDAREPGLAGQAFLAVVEGALSMDLPPLPRRRVVTFAYQRLIEPADPGRSPAHPARPARPVSSGGRSDRPRL
jgi:AcrR family transcriptional regulator